MKKNIFLSLFFCISLICYAQDQPTKGPSLIFNGPNTQSPKMSIYQESQNNESTLKIDLGNKGADKNTLEINGDLKINGDIIGLNEYLRDILYPKKLYIGDNKAPNTPYCLWVDGGVFGSENMKVNGLIRAKEVKVQLQIPWPDFVFDKNYKLPSLVQVQDYIDKNKHLSGMPSEQQVKDEGVDVVDMQAKLLQKVEELTLYIIDQNEKNEQLEIKIKQLEEMLIK